MSFNQVLHWLAFYGFARWLPNSTCRGGAIWKRIRYWAARPLFARCGQNVNIEQGATLGDRAVSIGSSSGIGIRAMIGPGVQIGSNVMMGPDVVILTTRHCISRIDIPMNEQGFLPVAPVIIGDDVWIGARVIILPGIRVGSGSVLGAGTVVTKDVPPYAVVVGNPGRVARYRSAAAPLETDDSFVLEAQQTL